MADKPDKHTTAIVLATSPDLQGDLQQADELHDPIVVEAEIYDPFVPGYYRALELDDPIPKGDLVYATHVDDYDYSKNDEDSTETQRVHFLYLDKGYTCGLQGFRKNYEFEPDGERIRNQQMTALADEMHALGDQEVKLNRQAIAFQPHVRDDGEFEANAEGTEASTAMVPTGATPDTAKKALATFRNDVAKLKNSVLAKSNQIKAMMAEKQAIMKAQLNALTAGIQEKMGELQKMVDKAQEAIWTINLYLGKDEEIVPIKRGKPAPKDTPIVIRQLVLWMDEEIAACPKYGDADYGGIDAKSIQNFDKWLIAHPEHLRQIMPEIKGVVVLKPRRAQRSYGDAWTQKAMEEANKASYFLIRNGDNLYRIWTDFDVGSTLLPSHDEFMGAFYEDDYDWKTNKRVRRPIKPGSEEYMRAMDRTEASRKHFYRVALILQGLLDRTKILHPLPIPRINVLNPAEYVGPDGEEHLKFIYDADKSNVLGDGRPSYDEWLEDANKNICVGQRIIGFFSFSYGERGYSSKNSRDSRLVPPSADLPSSLELHTIEAKGDKPGSFYIYYHRKDTVYRRGWNERSGPAKVRARCTVFQEDDFILNFDAQTVTVEAMEYYIGSRLNRHRYMDMIPLLRRAIAVKKQEEREEEPFRKMLVGVIMKEYEVEFAVAEEAVPELVRWWKFKNQTHRALLSNDKAAVKMILEEFGIRRKRSVERMGIEGDELTTELLQKAGKENEGLTVLLVAHKKGNEYVVLAAHNDENVFVREQLWAINRSSNCAWDQRVRLKESKDWRLADNRWERWKVISEHARWKDWIRDARAKGYLPDPERQRAVDMAEELITGSQQRIWGKKDKEEYDPDDWKDEVIPLAVARLHSDHDYFRVYYCDRQAIFPNILLSQRPAEPSIAVRTIEWKRDPKGEIKFSLSSDSYGDHISCSMGNPPWRERYSGSYTKDRGAITMKEWPAHVKEIYRQQELSKIYSSRARKLDDIPRSGAYSIEKQLEEREWAKKYEEYIKEYGDPELWEEHKKAERIKPRKYKTIQRRLKLMVERNLDCNGLTLAEFFKRTEEFFQEDLKAQAEKKAKKPWSYSYGRDDDDKEDEVVHDEDKDLIISHDPIPQEPLALKPGWDEEKPKKKTGLAHRTGDDDDDD